MKSSIAMAGRRLGAGLARPRCWQRSACRRLRRRRRAANGRPGSSRDQVIQASGRRPASISWRSRDRLAVTCRSTQPAGRRARLEYAGGAFGPLTWMFDFDAGDRLLASAQVRNEARFNAIRAGMDSEQVLRAIGQPSTIWPLGFQSQNVWAYRYESPFCQWFQVGVGYDGKVVDTAYGPDPLCEDCRIAGLLGAVRGAADPMSAALQRSPGRRPRHPQLRQRQAAPATWLDEQGIAHRFHDFKKHGVSADELAQLDGRARLGKPAEPPGDDLAQARRQCPRGDPSMPPAPPS